MKTRKEIRTYLRAQRWYAQYMENIKHPERKKSNLLNGTYERNSIRKAFDWNETPEGFEFWKKEDIKFQKWIDGPGIEELIIFVTFAIIAIGALIGLFWQPAQLFVLFLSVVAAAAQGYEIFRQ